MSQFDDDSDAAAQLLLMRRQQNSSLPPQPLQSPPVDPQKARTMQLAAMLQRGK